LGSRGRIKKSKVKEFISSNHLDFIAVQEIKLEVVNEILCHFLWGNPFCEWSFSPTIGNSGGILSIWCSSKGKTVFSFFGPGFIGLCFKWGVNKTRCYVVNIYAKCALRDKRMMWEKLIQFKHSFCEDVWCVE
jgi:hypothetical protein